MSDTIKQRLFVRQFSKYLKQTGTFIVVGKDISYTISICQTKGQTSCQTKPMSDTNPEEPKNMIDQEDKAYRMKYYGCGCEKVEGKLLCLKHGRT